MPEGQQRIGASVSVRCAPAGEVRDLVERHHYLKSLRGRFVVGLFAARTPDGALFGEAPIGAAVFGNPAREGVARALGGSMTTVIELTRFYTVDDVGENVGTWFLSRALRLLPAQYEVVVAFSDPSAGHHGGLYQAGSWLYLGQTDAAHTYHYVDRSGQRLSKKAPWIMAKRRGYPKGQISHGERIVAEERGWTRVEDEPKHRYAFPRTRHARRNLRPKALPYPAPEPQKKRSINMTRVTGPEEGRAAGIGFCPSCET